MIGSKTRLFHAIVGLGLAALPAAAACGGTSDGTGSTGDEDSGLKDGSVALPNEAGDASVAVDAGADGTLASDSGQLVDAHVDDGAADAADDGWSAVPIK